MKVLREANPFAEYLVGPDVVRAECWADGLQQGHVLIDVMEKVHTRTPLLLSIVASVSDLTNLYVFISMNLVVLQYSTLGLFPLQDLQNVDTLLVIVENFVSLLHEDVMPVGEEKGDTHSTHARRHASHEVNRKFCACVLTIFLNNLSRLSALLRSESDKDPAPGFGINAADTATDRLRYCLEAIIAHTNTLAPAASRSEVADASITGEAVVLFTKGFEVVLCVVVLWWWQSGLV